MASRTMKDCGVMQRRTVLKTLGGVTAVGGLAGCANAKAYICGDVPDFENHHGGQRVEVSGVADSVKEDGSRFFLEDHDSMVLVDVAPSSQRYVEMNVEEGDCVKVKGTVNHATGLNSIERASVE